MNKFGNIFVLWHFTSREKFVLMCVATGLLLLPKLESTMYLHIFGINYRPISGVTLLGEGTTGMAAFCPPNAK